MKHLINGMAAGGLTIVVIIYFLGISQPTEVLKVNFSGVAGGYVFISLYYAAMSWSIKKSMERD